jgi:formate hydrogenlyase subunit 3/multisubunit Na+/H+ antiporter MnhD subunit
MKKILNIICTIINWIIPFIILINTDKLNGGFTFYVTIGYFAFSVCWFIWRNSRSRFTYQIFFFAGYIIGLYNILSSNDTVFESCLHESSSSVSAGAKVFMVSICIIAFASKIVKMVLTTGDYREGATSRHNNRLDDKVYSATYEVEHARTIDERKRAEARLERAKLDKEKYSVDE